MGIVTKMRSLLFVLSFVNARYHPRYKWMPINSESASESAPKTELKLEQGPQDVILPSTKATTIATTKMTPKTTTSTTTTSTTKLTTKATTKATTTKPTPAPGKKAKPAYQSSSKSEEPTNPKSTRKKLDQEDDFMLSKGINRVILTPEYHIHHTLPGIIVIVIWRTIMFALQLVMAFIVIFWLSLLFYKKRHRLQNHELMDHLAKDLAHGASLPGKLRRKYGEKLREDNEFEFTEASQKVKKTKKAKSKETKQSHQVENEYIYSYQYELQSDDSLSA